MKEKGKADLGPIRMCAICRKRFPKRELMRFACRDKGTRLIPDPEQKLSGRGKYVCSQAKCREKFQSATGLRNIQGG